MSERPLVTLRRPKLLHESVQESLKAFIVENRLTAGMPLPPEGELAQQLGVSRGSVREAIRALESIGIIESRRGIGVFVAAFSFAPLLNNLVFGLRGTAHEVAEMLQVRRALELGLIANVVDVADDAEVDGLRRITDRMRDRAAAGESFADDDQRFHQALFQALGNTTLLHLLDVFWMAFFKASNDLTLSNPDPMSTWRDHAAIVDALAARDAQATRDRLDQHYDGIARLLARQSSKPSQKETP
jgi:DNA-binding FadR family transcriptional regulator